MRAVGARVTGGHSRGWRLGGWHWAGVVSPTRLPTVRLALRLGLPPPGSRPAARHFSALLTGCSPVAHRLSPVSGMGTRSGQSGEEMPADATSLPTSVLTQDRCRAEAWQATATQQGREPRCTLAEQAPNAIPPRARTRQSPPDPHAFKPIRKATTEPTAPDRPAIDGSLKCANHGILACACGECRPHAVVPYQTIPSIRR
jgi:hypothetical protein